MSRLAYLPLVGLVALAGYGLWPLLSARPLPAEADNTTLLEAIGTEIKAGNAALTPTKTPYLTSTPTRTPKPPTATPQPTYAGQTEAGWYVVEAWTETPVVASTQEPDEALPCATVTARPYEDQPCRVDEP